MKMTVSRAVVIIMGIVHKTIRLPPNYLSAIFIMTIMIPLPQYGGYGLS